MHPEFLKCSFFAQTPPHPPNLPQASECGEAHSLKQYLLCGSPVPGTKIKGSGVMSVRGNSYTVPVGETTMLPAPDK